MMKDLNDMLGLVAELRDCLKDILPYLPDPAASQVGTFQAQGNAEPSTPIGRLEAQLSGMKRQAEIIARARRLINQ